MELTLAQTKGFVSVEEMHASEGAWGFGFCCFTHMVQYYDGGPTNQPIVRNEDCYSRNRAQLVLRKQDALTVATNVARRISAAAKRTQAVLQERRKTRLSGQIRRGRLNTLRSGQESDKEPSTSPGTGFTLHGSVLQDAATKHRATVHTMGDQRAVCRQVQPVQRPVSAMTPLVARPQSDEGPQSPSSTIRQSVHGNGDLRSSPDAVQAPVLSRYEQRCEALIPTNTQCSQAAAWTTLHRTVHYRVCHQHHHHCSSRQFIQTPEIVRRHREILEEYMTNSYVNGLFCFLASAIETSSEITTEDLQVTQARHLVVGRGQGALDRVTHIHTGTTEKKPGGGRYAHVLFITASAHVYEGFDVWLDVFDTVHVTWIVTGGSSEWMTLDTPDR